MGSISKYPTSDQVTLMKNDWQQTSVTEDNTSGTIGMFGENDRYYFYMKITVNSGDLWQQALTQNKEFMMIFQMGDTQSEWTGLQYSLDDDLISGHDKIQLDKLSVTNDVKTQGASQISTDGRNNSDFEGTLAYSGDDVVIELLRETEKSEQTDDDGSVVRIEAGRSLSGTYYSSTGSAVNFEVTLTNAVSLVGLAGLCLATSITMLAF